MPRKSRRKISYYRKRSRAYRARRKSKRKSRRKSKRKYRRNSRARRKSKRRKSRCKYRRKSRRSRAYRAWGLRSKSRRKSRRRFGSAAKAKVKAAVLTDNQRRALEKFLDLKKKEKHATATKEHAKAKKLKLEIDKAALEVWKLGTKSSKLSEAIAANKRRQSEISKQNKEVEIQAKDKSKAGDKSGALMCLRDPAYRRRKAGLVQLQGQMRKLQNTATSYAQKQLNLLLFEQLEGKRDDLKQLNIKMKKQLAQRLAKLRVEKKDS